MKILFYFCSGILYRKGLRGFCLARLSPGAQPIGLCDHCELTTKGRAA